MKKAMQIPESLPKIVKIHFVDRTENIGHTCADDMVVIYLVCPGRRRKPCRQ